MCVLIAISNTNWVGQNIFNAATACSSVYMHTQHHCVFNALLPDFIRYDRQVDTRSDLNQSQSAVCCYECKQQTINSHSVQQFVFVWDVRSVPFVCSLMHLSWSTDKNLQHVSQVNSRLLSIEVNETPSCFCDRSQSICTYLRLRQLLEDKLSWCRMSSAVACAHACLIEQNSTSTITPFSALMLVT